MPCKSSEKNHSSGRVRARRILEELKRIEKNFVFIFVGEKHTLDKLDPLLKSIFVSIIDIKSYSDEEIIKIARSIAKNYGYKINTTAKKMLLQYFNKLNVSDKNYYAIENLIKNTILESPTIVDGIEGVKFIEACLENSENGNVWVEM